MGKRIYLTEEQFIKLTGLSLNDMTNLIGEGVSYGNKNGNFMVNVNQNTTDDANLTGNFVDTRVFGTRNDILYGDDTNNMITNLSDTVLQRRAIITTMYNLINYIQAGRQGKIFSDKNLPGVTKKSIEKWLKTLSDEEIIEKATQTKNYWLETGKQKEGLFNRANLANYGDKVEKYTIFEIGNTGVKCIALFSMKDFTFSDVIKHGEISTSNPNITNKDDYTLNKNGKINVRYDDDIVPDIEQNFSLKNTNDWHYKTQYQLQKNDSPVYNNQSNEKTYTTINQFLDKSILYANHALKKEKFIPSLIVTVPSSSKMNHYYATNLSRKIGCQYIPDFFKRNIINAHVKDGLTDEELMKRGLTPIMIERLKNEIKDYAYQEITYEIEQPIRKIVNDNLDLFSNISKEKNSRDKFDIKRVISMLSNYCFRTIEPMIGKDDAVCKHLCRNFMKLKDYTKDQNMLGRIMDIINLKIGRKTFDQALFEMKKLLEYYRNEIDKGYHPGIKQYGLGQAKITRIPKTYREYVEGSFIITDKYAKENSHFFDSLINKNILIVDEDINTGSSFQLTIDALKSNINNKPDNTIMCLANGYSEAGNRYY